MLLTAAFLVARGPWAGASSGPAYLDWRRPIPQRVSDLLARMTPAEKVGQMDMIEVSQVTDASNSCAGQSGFGEPNAVCMQKVLRAGHTGALLAGGSDNPPDTTHHGGPGNTGRDWANEYNTIQRFAIQHSRLHIPLIFGVDATHGFGHPFTAPLFPQPIGMGATWDPALAWSEGRVTANALRATGWVWDFAPVQDPARDNRWGRYYEAWSEEPALAAAVGESFVRGLQSPAQPGMLRVAATVKHFAGYSESINGHDRVAAQLPIRYLQDQFLPSYAGGLQAGAGAVMVDSGSINGIPATASHFLLTDELRRRLGFSGVVVSDYGDVPALFTTYHVASDLAGAIASAVNAGVDVSMEPFNPEQFQAAILHDVQIDKISSTRIDEAVRRILTLKFRLGLFDQPCVKDPSKPCVDPGKADTAVKAGRALALQATRASITLLRNENHMLPLSPSTRLVVTGPNADSLAHQLGGWSVGWQGLYDPGAHSCCMGPPDQIPSGSTVLQGLQAEDRHVVYATSTASAVAAARTADAIVAVVGEKAYAEGAGDNPAPALPPSQQALIRALEATGKPVIVAVIAGRPLGLGPAARADALLMAYQGSTEAGTAAADVIFGKVDPSGKLPVTWPSDAATSGADFATGAPSPLGDQPKVFDQFPDTGSGPGSAYNPLFPFGFGLSYTTFQTSALTVTPSAGIHGTLTARFTVANTGSRAGTDIVPVYVHQPVSAVLVPPQRLVGFVRVALQRGQSRIAQVSFPATELAVTPGDIDGTEPSQVVPGSYQVQIGAVTPTMTANFTIHR